MISVVCPAYNEETCLPEFVRRTHGVLRSIGEPFEILIVDDGSRDQTVPVAHRLRREYPELRVVELSRNFGHEMASTAGLSQARGDALVLIDSDLQDPPELVSTMWDKHREGFDVVYAQRVSRDGESLLKRGTSWLFYRLFRFATGVDMPPDVGDFRLMDRKVVDQLLGMPERRRLVRGMVAWLGFRQTAVPFERAARYGGESKYDVTALLGLTIDSLTGFTTKPLRLATYTGFALGAFGLIGFLYIFIQKLFPSLAEIAPWLGLRTPGYALLMCSLFVLGGMQCVLLGVVGEYVGRIYEQVQDRPLFVIRRVTPEAGECESTEGGSREPAHSGVGPWHAPEHGAPSKTP